MPTDSMVVTPMPALPAPTMTKRCLVMSDRGRSWMARAPYTPPHAVAAVPCMQLWDLVLEVVECRAQIVEQLPALVRSQHPL